MFKDKKWKKERELIVKIVMYCAIQAQVIFYFIRSNMNRHIFREQICTYFQCPIMCRQVSLKLINCYRYDQLTLTKLNLNKRKFKWHFLRGSSMFCSIAIKPLFLFTNIFGVICLIIALKDITSNIIFYQQRIYVRSKL